MLECRIEPGSDVCFCDFVAQIPGKVLDLSYNDTPMYEYRMLLSNEEQRVAQGSIERLLNDPDVFAHWNDKEYLKGKIKNDVEEHNFSKAVIEESIAKQYLKSICSCIYTKVDDSDKAEKARIYDSNFALE